MAMGRFLDVAGGLSGYDIDLKEHIVEEIRKNFYGEAICDQTSRSAIFPDTE